MKGTIPKTVRQCPLCKNYWPKEQGDACVLCNVTAPLVPNTYGLKVPVPLKETDEQRAIALVGKLALEPDERVQTEYVLDLIRAIRAAEP